MSTKPAGNLPNRPRLEGRRAIIAEACTSVGRRTAEVFLREGATVGVIGRDQQPLDQICASLARISEDFVPYRADVTRGDEVEAALAKLVFELGGVQILVNSAGLGCVAPFFETTEDVLQTIMAANVTSAFLVTHHALPHMLRMDSGKIINIAGETGCRGVAWQTAESAARSAVIGFTQSLAEEFAEDGICVNAICPGVIKDAHWPRVAAQFAPKLNASPDAVEGLLTADMPLGRLATPDDVASTALFLASSDSDYITGQAILLAGGKLM